VIRNELRHAFRSCAKNRAFTALVCLILALGIGPNTAIFSLVHGLLIKPLPFPDFGRLVTIWETDLRRGKDRENVAPANFLDWKNQSSLFENLACYQWWDANITGDGDPEQVQGMRTSANFFVTIGVPAMLGRTFATEEEMGSGDDLAVISYGMWQRRFGRESDTVGKTLIINGRRHTIIGIMPQDFNFPVTAEVWVPRRLLPDEAVRRDIHFLDTIGRLKSNITKQQAQSELQTIARRLAVQYPQTNRGRGSRLVTLQERIIIDSGTRKPLVILMAASTLILLLACANVANLHLMRALNRRKELAIRAAVGASAWRVGFQLLTESVLMALISALGALLLAWWCVYAIKGSLPADIAKWVPGWKEIGLHPPVLGFMLLAGVTAGLISGMAPAFMVVQPNLQNALKEGGRSGSAGRRSHWLRNSLVAAEVALSLMLLVGAGIMVKGFSSLVKTPRGFVSDQVLTMRLTLPESKYRTRHEIINFYAEALRGWGAIPQVQAVAVSTHLPYAHRGWTYRSLQIEGRPTPTPEQTVQVAIQAVSADYFRVLQIPVRQERVFTSREDGESLPVAVISERLARQHWPKEVAISKKIQLGATVEETPSITIIGMVGDVRRHWSDHNFEALYLPYQHLGERSMSVALRLVGNPKSVMPSLRAQLKLVDPEQPITQVKMLNEIIAESMAGLRLPAGILAFLGVLAALLAGAGVYSVMGYAVIQRKKEIGIRMALGAQRGDVLRLIVGDAAKLSLVGLAIGLPGAFALSRVLGSLYAGAAPLNMLSVLALAFASVGLVMLGSLSPAAKAAKIDPVITLQNE